MDTSQSQPGLVDYVTENSTKCSAALKNKSPKVCGVCGDVAKSLHFGAICCDSCKAFFRRSIQNAIWETFLCVKDGQCEVTQNRRCCQACRFSLCRRIGMNPSLVMSEEDRKLLMSRKLERKRQQLIEHHRKKQQNLVEEQHLRESETELQERICLPRTRTPEMKEEEIANDRDSSPSSFDVKEEFKEEQMEDDSPEDTGFDPVTVDHFKEDFSDEEKMEETRLQQEDLERIALLQKLLRKGLSFPEFPRHYYEEDADVTEHLFFVFCKGLGNFFSRIPDFRELETQDRNVLLKDAVSKAIFIFAAHQYQEHYEYWPRKLLSASCSFPKVTMAAMEKFLGDQDAIFRMKDFMRRFRPFFEDEVMMLLSLMVAVFDQKDAVIPGKMDIAERKNRYLALLENYLHDCRAEGQVIFSELFACIREVDELVECLRRSSSKEKDNAKTQEEATFASSLHDLGADSRLPPKKAFNKKAKLGNTSDVIFLEEISHENTREEGSPSSFQSPTNCAAYNDHDYLKPGDFASEDPLTGSHFPTATSVLRTKELEIIPLPQGSQPVYWCPREEIPTQTTRKTPVSGHARESKGSHRSFGVSFPLSKEVDLIQPVSASVSMRRTHPSSLHHRPSPRAVFSPGRLQLSQESRAQMPQGIYPVSPQRNFLPSKVQASHYPHQVIPHQVDMYQQIDTATEPSDHPGSYEEPRPSSASSSSSSCSLSTSSRQSPVTRVCHGIGRLSAQDDQQILQAVQGVLPPHLVTHLASRLAAVRGAARKDE